MKIARRSGSLLLFIGDMVVFTIALWITLAIRYNGVLELQVFVNHLFPFSILFILYSLVFLIAGLYERHTSVLKAKLGDLILNSQIVNAFVASAFFYFIPSFGIAPKANLFLYVIFSSILIFIWRGKISEWLMKGKKSKAVLIGSGEEIEELYKEINGNSLYDISFERFFDLKKEEVNFEDFKNYILDSNISLIIADMRSEAIKRIILPIYTDFFDQISVVDSHKIYEDVFERIPLSLINEDWFMENISAIPQRGYDLVKRFFDIIFGSILFILSLPFYPLVLIALKIQDGGPLFVSQERIGKGGKIVILKKFRSMKGSDRGKWISGEDDRHTGVGKFIRKTRIDELPQLMSVIYGSISLVGPRPDIIGIGEELISISNYKLRYIIKPGLSGWAQIKQDLPPQSFEETMRRLSYDLYYIKNRSVMLDIVIALKTLKTLVSRRGM